MLHLSPRPLPQQRVVWDSIACAPEPARVASDTDHFGNRVTWLFLDRPHARFEVVAEAEVETAFPAPPLAGLTPPWEQVAAEAARHPEAAEFTYPSPMLPEQAAARAYAALSFPAGRPVLEGLLELNGRIKRDFTFRAGVTGIATPVAQVLAQRAGVCQDFTNLMLCGLRGLGLPARYVSGYIRTRPPPGGVARGSAPTSRMPGWAPGWASPSAGSTSTPPTTWWCSRSMWCWAGGATSTTSPRCAASSWAAASTG
ncbi:transglutaminase N-terminal domain-containing protein [Pseudoroseomonas cervicalis]|uniref:transglutaminase family protein n=1 Tax=Teichococcus cervicalis TaxID=204525 RepID=UPI0035EE1219